MFPLIGYSKKNLIKRIESISIVMLQMMEEHSRIS